MAGDEAQADGRARDRDGVDEDVRPREELRARRELLQRMADEVLRHRGDEDTDGR